MAFLWRTALLHRKAILQLLLHTYICNFKCTWWLAGDHLIITMCLRNDDCERYTERHCLCWLSSKKKKHWRKNATLHHHQQQRPNSVYDQVINTTIITISPTSSSAATWTRVADNKKVHWRQIIVIIKLVLHKVWSRVGVIISLLLKVKS